MKIELYYPGRCANGTVLYTKDPIETIKIVRESRLYGEDKIHKSSVVTNELHIPKGGKVELELTHINAQFILNAVRDELLQLPDEDQLAIIEAFIKKAGSKKKKGKAADEDEDGLEDGAVAEVLEKEVPPVKSSKVVAV